MALTARPPRPGLVEFISLSSLLIMNSEGLPNILRVVGQLPTLLSACPAAPPSCDGSHSGAPKCKWCPLFEPVMQAPS